MRGPRLLIVLAALAALAVAFVLLRPKDRDGATPTATALSTREAETTSTAEPQPDPARLVVTIRDGRPVDGIVRVSVRKDDTVLVTVRSNVADHVHVHGYDLVAPVEPGRPAQLRFRADLTGRFELELEGTHRQIAQLTVLP